MIKYFFSFILFVHGIIHTIGFSKAFGIAKVSELRKSISKFAGSIWLLTALIFIAAGISYLMKREFWWIYAAAGVVLSQILILSNWKDAKFGTISNLIILPALLIGYFSWNFKNKYLNDVTIAMENCSIQNSLLTEADLQTIPPVVRKYIRYTHALNKPKVQNFKVEFSGEMRGKNQKWFNFKSEQYNFTQSPTRLFYMKALIKNLPFSGYHKYLNGDASMQVKLFSEFPVVNLKAGELNQAETVTYFNEMCLLAPGSLTDSRIKWGHSDSTSAEATFTNNESVINATLYFNAQGQLINFVSDDRYDVSSGQSKKFRFSTPVTKYEEINGMKLFQYGESIWHYPEGEFVYGKFNLETIEYNISNL